MGKELTPPGPFGQPTPSWDSLGLVMGLGYIQVLPTPILFPQPCDYGVIPGLPWCLKTQDPHCELGHRMGVKIQALIRFPDLCLTVPPVTTPVLSLLLGLPLLIQSLPLPQNSVTYSQVHSQTGTDVIVPTLFLFVGILVSPSPLEKIQTSSALSVSPHPRPKHCMPHSRLHQENRSKSQPT